MSWLQIVLSLLTALPGLVTEIENLIKSIKGQPQAVQSAMRVALTHAVNSKDADVMNKAVQSLARMT